MEQLKSIQLADNVNLYIIPCDIYKTTSISIFIPCELNDNYTYHALFPQVLKRGTVLHPDQRSIEVLMQELYGANFGTSVKKYGNKQILSFSMDIADSQYIQSHENLFSYAVNFLHELMFEPVTENGLFRHEYVLQEAFNLKQQIMSIINNKFEYSGKRLVEEMDPGKQYVKCQYGDEKELDNIDPQKLFEVYTDIINNNPVDIFVAGNIGESEIKSVFADKFNFSNRKALKPYSPDTVIPQNVRFVDEAMDVKQGKLNIGFRTNITAANPDYFKLLMFNAVFGGTVNSKLFMNVRERLSLCYYCSSTIDRLKNVMFVISGVEAKKYEEARREIESQLAAVAEGRFTDDEFENAKAYLIDSIRGFTDSEGALASMMLAGTLRGELKTPEQEMQEIAAVTREDLIAIAKEAALDTVYFLKGVHNEE